MDTNPEDSFAHRPFRFEAAWVRDNECNDVVEKAWNEKVGGLALVKLCKKQVATRSAIRKWNKEVFRHCQAKINKLMDRITNIQKNTPFEDNDRAEKALQVELSEWLERCEILWKQKSRELWLKEEDRNTKLFHLSTIIQRRYNNIDAIRSDDGSWVTNSKDIRIQFFNSFKRQFTEEEVYFPDNLDNVISPCITEKDNALLRKIPTPDEIKATLFQMQDLKAPGQDGFPALFYKEFWHIVGDAVTQAVISFLVVGSMPKEVNGALIVLIPKTLNLSSVNNFRPISLCNIVYKIISKLLVAKICPILHNLISPCQSAFIPGRWIAKNQVVIHELLHSFKVRKVKSSFMAVKLDFQKAYDRVNWSFIQTVLTNFGFDSGFIGWILACLSSVSFEVLVNGGKTDQFKPSRGLRQGDPLSPYLFILGQEVLSRLLDKELYSGNLS